MQIATKSLVLALLCAAYCTSTNAVLVDSWHFLGKAFPERVWPRSVPSLRGGTHRE